jgi:adenine-specific DNA-methyltransferase
MSSHYGRLELTWANKHLRLLAHEGGRYEWTDYGDYRVAEVRLLREVEKIGDYGNGSGPDNLLIRGDALHALRSLAQLPEVNIHVLGSGAC